MSMSLSIKEDNCRVLFESALDIIKNQPGWYQINFTAPIKHPMLDGYWKIHMAVLSNEEMDYEDWRSKLCHFKVKYPLYLDDTSYQKYKRSRRSECLRLQRNKCFVYPFARSEIDKTQSYLSRDLDAQLREDGTILIHPPLDYIPHTQTQSGRVRLRSPIRSPKKGEPPLSEATKRIKFIDRVFAKRRLGDDMVMDDMMHVAKRHLGCHEDEPN